MASPLAVPALILAVLATVRSIAKAKEKRAEADKAKAETEAIKTLVVWMIFLVVVFTVLAVFLPSLREPTSMVFIGLVIGLTLLLIKEKTRR